MRRKVFFIIVLFALFFPFRVFADYSKLQLIPIGEITTVDDIGYTYRNIQYINQVEGETYGVFKIELVTNKDEFKKPLAIDFLLFDSEKKNIGFVAYCTTKDLNGEYAQIQVNASASSPLTVFVDSSYFVEGYTKDNIAYYAVLDSNEKCFVGNQNKYAGLTIEEIANGDVSPDWKDNDFINFFSFILNMGIYTFLGVLLVIMTIYTIYIACLNALHKKMFGKKARYRFIPIYNCYLSLKISFGRILAFLGLIGLIGSIYFGLYESEWIFFYIVLGFIILSILINVIKYFSHNYDLFFFDPFIKNDGSNSVYSWRKVKIKGKRKAKQIINLNYSDQDLQTQMSRQSGPDIIVPVAVPQVDTAEDIINRIDNTNTLEQNDGFQMPTIQNTPVNNMVSPSTTPVVSNDPVMITEPVITMVPDTNPTEIAIPSEFNNTEVPSSNPVTEDNKEDSQSDFMDMFR